LAFLTLLALSCAQPPPAATVRLDDDVTPSIESPQPQGAPAVEAPARQNQRLKLSGAINEILGFSFSVEPRTDLPNPVVRMTGFETAGGRPSLRLDAFRIHDVETPQLPGWHIRSIPPRWRLSRTPDVLVPVDAPSGGLRETVRAGNECRLWIDLHIEKGTPPGVYAGAIELSVEDQRVAGLEVELTVWPFVLPDEPEVPVIVEVDHRALIRHLVDGTQVSSDYWADAPQAAAVNESILGTVRLLREHGLTPVLPHLKPKVAPDARGEAQIEWALFDTITSPLMDGSAFDDRLGLKVGYLPLDDVFDFRDSPSGTAAGESLLRKYVTRCVAHYKEKGWFDRAYAVLPFGIADPAAPDLTAQLSELLSSASAGEIRLASPLFPQDMTPYGWTGFRFASLEDAVDVWLPPAQFYDRPKLDEERDRGGQTWLSVDRPPYSGSVSIHAKEPSARVLTWQAIVAPAAALHVGVVNDWPNGAGSASPEACIRHKPDTLIYPGREFGLAAAVPSLRLKWLRRAAQDAAYVRLLREQGLQHVAHALSTALLSYFGSDAYRTHYADAKPIGWPAESEPFDVAREIMGDELARAVSGASGERDVERFSRSAAWQRLLRTTRGVRLSFDGCRVRRIHTAGGGDAEIACTVSVDNDRRTAISGEVRWSTDDSVIRPESPKRIDGLSPGATRKTTLTGRTTAPALSQNGDNRFKFVFATSEGPVYETVENLAYVVAQPARTPLRIDGDLADWPPGTINVAGDFRLISPADARSADTERSPKARTTAYVLRDDENLYVAVHCQSPPGAASDLAQKRLQYDDLIPRGGDLVELLFDPLNLGTRSPADLYHIVLQRSGSDFAEKGIGLDPPVGGRQIWPADLDVAIRRGPDQWVAEVKIPLAAFPGGRPRGEIWGFNITRFDAADEEFSTWSGAVGNAYDPMSLGNLYLP
jgi:hypothetical protein